MAGGNETPEQRKARDQAVADADQAARDAETEAAHELTAAAVPSGLPRAGGPNATLTAAAASVRLDDRKAVAALRRRRQGWHDEACDYVKEIGELGYCADAETEIMTADGWRRHEDVAAGDVVLTLNVDEGVAEWQQCSGVHRFDVTDRSFLSIESPGHSSLTSMNHRWPVLRYVRKRSGETHYRDEWTTSAELTSHHRLLTSAPCADVPTAPKWTDAFVELVAWFWTEGTISNNVGQGSYRASICQSSGVNPGNVGRIRAALTAVFGSPSETLRSGNLRAPAAWREYHRPNRPLVEWHLNHEATAHLLEVAPGKVVTTEFIGSLTTAQLHLFIDRSIDADGHMTRSARAITQAVPERLAAFEMACILAGYTTHFYESSPGCWCVHVSLKSTRLVRLRSMRRVSYTGTMWCPSTPNGTWLARRKGHVYFTGNTVEYAANLMSKLRLFPAVRTEPGAEPVPVMDEESGVDADTAKLCVDVLDRLRSPQGGQSALLYGIGWNMEVTGDLYLHGHEVTPDEASASEGVLTAGEEMWFVRSVRQLVPMGEGFVLRTTVGSTAGAKVPAGDAVKRLWNPDPEFDELSTSPVRRVLSICENLLLASRTMRAVLMSHLPAGFLVKPQELTFGSIDPTRRGDDGEAADDPFEQNLQDILLSPIQEPGSAAAIAPGLLTGPAEFVKKDLVWHLTFARPIDQLLVSWIEGLVMRLARGMNMPVEVTTGLQETTFANAGAVKQSEWDSHGEPRALLIVDAITVGYYREALVKSGVDAQRAADIFVWYDPTACIAAPDQTDSADHGSQEGLIRDEAWRRVRGYSDADAPSDDELLRRLAYAAPKMDPFMAAQLWRKTGMFPEVMIPAPPAGIVGPDGQIVGGPPSAGEIAAAVTDRLAASGVVAASSPRRGKGAALGRKLAAIDRDLRTRVHVAAEQALRRALERAGAKIRPRLGRSGPAQEAAAGVPNRLVAATVGRDVVAAAAGDVDFGGEFDELADDLGAWVEVAWRQAVDAVQAVYGPLSQARVEELAGRLAQNVPAAQEQLKARMVDLAGRRLYDPTPGAATVGEADASSAVPAYVAREALAVAGGDSPQGGDGSPLTSEDGSPVGGVATGPDVMGETGGVEGYVWDYGAAPRAPFPPHEDLDGVEFVSFDDNVLSNDGFPGPYLAPGDHDGCFPAGALVSGPPVRGATLRHYKGKVVVVGTAGGEDLTATPNHPVLTDRGWVAAGLLREGDQVVRCVDADGVASLVPHDGQVPTSIEDVPAAFEVDGGVAPRRVPVTSVNFHGDAAEGDVCVVWTDCRLVSYDLAAVGEPSGEAALAGARPAFGAGLAGEGGSGHLLGGVGHAALGVVGGDRLLPPLGGRELGRGESGAGLHASTLDAGTDQALLDGAPVDAVAQSDLILRVAGQVGGHDGGVGQDDGELGPRDLASSQPIHGGPVAGQATLGEYLPQEGRSETEADGGLVAGRPVHVRLDSVVEVCERAFEGHVYNLHTEGHWYVANGLVVSNCVCDITPILLDPAEVDGGEAEGE